MIYLGNDTYEIILDGKVVNITINDIKEIIYFIEQEKSFNKLEDILDVNIIENINKDTKKKYNHRTYNKGRLIVEKFNEKYNKNRTKKSVYEEIAKELDIKWKSVQKTYLKNK